MHIFTYLHTLFAHLAQCTWLARAHRRARQSFRLSSLDSRKNAKYTHATRIRCGTIFPSLPSLPLPLEKSIYRLRSTSFITNETEFRKSAIAKKKKSPPRIARGSDRIEEQKGRKGVKKSIPESFKKKKKKKRYARYKNSAVGWKRGPSFHRYLARYTHQSHLHI